MKFKPETTLQNSDLSGLSAGELRASASDYQAPVMPLTPEEQDRQLRQQNAELKALLVERNQYIQILEELLRLKKTQQFAASSEKHIDQIKLFDETELEAEIESLRDQLPDDLTEEDAPASENAQKKRRQRGFSDNLARRRIELFLSDEEKAGADSVFFTKIKEELHFTPAHLEVLEYWQEKAVFKPTEPNG